MDQDKSSDSPNESSLEKDRFPRMVYGIGQEPDPRFSLANERTFLAWIRTALALLAVGIALEALPVISSPSLRFVASFAFIVLAGLTSISSWLLWARTERALRENKALPGLTMGFVVAVGVVVAIVVVGAGFLL